MIKEQKTLVKKTSISISKNISDNPIVEVIIMDTNFLKFLKHQLIIITGMVFITISLIFGNAEAGNNWLEKGTDLLKTYG